MQPQVIICKDRVEWLEARKDGLGASDAAALLGLSPWKTNVQLWEEKCGLVIPEDIGDKPYVRSRCCAPSSPWTTRNTG